MKKPPISSSNISIDMETAYELDKLRKENALLQLRVEALTTHISQEELICIDQIALLNELSKTRPLNKEEAQKFDIFVRNLRMIREKPKVIEAEYGNLSKDDLLNIAQN